MKKVIREEERRDKRKGLVLVGINNGTQNLWRPHIHKRLVQPLGRQYYRD